MNSSSRRPGPEWTAAISAGGILVVCDDPTRMESLRSPLAEVARLRFASDTQEAFRQAHAAVPDLVLLDTDTLATSAGALLASFRADPQLIDVPVIIVSSRACDEIAALEMGALDFIAKPFNTAGLAARVRNHLRRYQAAAEQRRVAHAHAEQLAAIVISSNDAIISKDLASRITFWNAAAERIFGFSATEMVGQSIKQLIPPDRQGEEEKILDAIKRGERVQHFETIRQTKDQRLLNVSVTVSPIKNTSGEIIGASKIARDVTELIQMRNELKARNEALERSNLELQQFAYVASHDLQTPLRGIHGFIQLLSDSAGDRLDPSQRDWLRLAMQAATHMQRLIHDVLEYSQVDSRVTQFVDVSMNDLVEEVVGVLEIPIREVGGMVSYEPLPVVRGDRSQLLLLLQNLLGNALKYHGKEAPRVQVSAQRREDEWLLAVEDNGIGIAAKHHEKIFEIFKRLHTQQEFPGTGIGLAICRRVVERHGGSLWVESPPRGGSRFCFTLPMTGAFACQT